MSGSSLSCSGPGCSFIAVHASSPAVTRLIVTSTAGPRGRVRYSSVTAAQASWNGTVSHSHAQRGATTFAAASTAHAPAMSRLGRRDRVPDIADRLDGVGTQL